MSHVLYLFELMSFPQLTSVDSGYSSLTSALAKVIGTNPCMFHRWPNLIYLYSPNVTSLQPH